MKKYCVTVVRYGNVFVEAEIEEEAMDIADHQLTDTINWSDYWGVTDCMEDDTLEDCLYVREKAFE